MSKRRTAILYEEYLLADRATIDGVAAVVHYADRTCSRMSPFSIHVFRHATGKAAYVPDASDEYDGSMDARERLRTLLFSDVILEFSVDAVAFDDSIRRHYRLESKGTAWSESSFLAARFVYGESRALNSPTILVCHDGDPVYLVRRGPASRE